MMRVHRCRLLISLASLLQVPGALAFLASPPSPPPTRASTKSAALSVTAYGALSLSTRPFVVVISPPGGVGEVAAVKAAHLGSKVRWFVVSGGEDEAKQRGRAASSSVGGATVVTLSSQALERVSQAGGSLKLAGASASTLLADLDDPSSALPAVAAWCQGVSEGEGVLICTLDGISDALSSPSSSRKRKRSENDSEEANDPAIVWKNAVKVAVQEASKAVGGRKIAILSATEDDDPSDGGAGEEDKGGALGSLVGNLFGGRKPGVPTSLAAALSGEGRNLLCRIRHGELFGTPESSPDFSPLVGGPRRSPEPCEEYTMRSVRVDPARSVAGNLMTGSGSRSSRHAVGEAAALVALEKVSVSGGGGAGGIDVCVTSLRGTEEVSADTWNQEFQRATKMMFSASSGADGGAPVLFAAEFSSVPDLRRLSDWLATKWAPAILRTYDIAAIRVGSRPVYAVRTDDDRVEVVWQQLVDFESVTVGKMVIKVGDTGLVAVRGAGDASKGFGTVTRRPLAGEDVLVRRLADAVAQAMEKGLANKPIAPKPLKEERIVSAPVTSIQASGTVEVQQAMAAPTATAFAVVEPEATTEKASAVPPPSTPPPPVSSSQGPRQPGARRSTERARGTKRRRGGDSNKVES